MNALLSLMMLTSLTPVPTVVWTVTVKDMDSSKEKTYSPGSESLPIPTNLKDIYCTVSKTVESTASEAEMFTKILKCHSGDFMSQIAASCIRFKNEKESFSNTMYIMNQDQSYAIRLECE